jgi:hypothetical protein
VRTSGEPFWFHCGVHQIQILEKKWYMGGVSVPCRFGGGKRDQKKIARFLYCIAIGSQKKKKGGAKMFFTFIIHL